MTEVTDVKIKMFTNEANLPHASVEILYDDGTTIKVIRGGKTMKDSLEWVSKFGDSLAAASELLATDAV